LSATNLINWNDGRLVTLSAGQAARCENLVKDQLYAVLIYNSSQIDVDAAVTVVWSNQVPPSKVTVRGSTGEGAPASYLFVSGADSDFISISLGPNSEASITAFIVSISMPLNTTGLNSAVLALGTDFHSFNKYDRYYMEAGTGWSNVTIDNPTAQFICLQMNASNATVIVVNMGSQPVDELVNKFGPTATKVGTVLIDERAIQSYQNYIPGNSGTWVWMNGDSPLNSKTAGINLQQLSTLKAMLHMFGIHISKLTGKNTIY
jgi:hypothetical protein